MKKEEFGNYEEQFKQLQNEIHSDIVKVVEEKVSIFKKRYPVLIRSIKLTIEQKDTINSEPINEFPIKIDISINV